MTTPVLEHGQKARFPTMKQDLLKGLTEDQIAKVKACGSNEEIFELAKKEGVTLTDEQLEVVNGVMVTWRRCKDCRHLYYVL